MLAVTPVVFLLLSCHFSALCSSVSSTQLLACLCTCFYTIPAARCSLYNGFTSDAAGLTDFGVLTPQRNSSLCTGMVLQRLIAPKTHARAPLLQICSSLMAILETLLKIPQSSVARHLGSFSPCPWLCWDLNNISISIPGYLYQQNDLLRVIHVPTLHGFGVLMVLR